jgi:prophage antirepressor-like protein
MHFVDMARPNEQPIHASNGVVFCSSQPQMAETTETAASNEVASVVKAFAYGDISFDVNIIGTMDEPLFQANQIGELLGLGNIRSSLALLDDDMTQLHTVDTGGGPRTATFLTEAGLYMFLFRSRVPFAKEFRRWACNVLKQMRLDMMRNQTLEIEKVRLLTAESEFKERERERVYAAQEAEKSDAHKKQMLELKIRQLELEKEVKKDEVPDITGFDFNEVDRMANTQTFRVSYAITTHFLKCGQYVVDRRPQKIAVIAKFRPDLANWSKVPFSTLDKAAVELAIRQVGATWNEPLKVIYGLVRKGGKCTAHTCA